MGSTKTILKRATAYALAFVMAFSMLFTGNNVVTTNAAAAVTKITVAKKSVSIEPGKKLKVKVTVKGGNKKFTAKSSNKKVATVKVVGKYVQITAKKKLNKTAKITVTTKGKNKKGKKLSAKITVKVENKTDDTAAQKAATDQAAVTTAQTALNALPAATAVTTADEAKITEARKTYDALTPDQKALVPADVVKKLTDAEAALKAAKDAADAQAASGITSVAFDSASYTIETGKSVQALVTVLPADAKDKTVTYTSSNASVASVTAAGVIIGGSAGTATITATCGGKSATATVTVVAPVNIVLSATELTIGLNQTANITSSVENVTWSSDNTDVATVDAGGKVKGISAGTANITARSGSATATCKVTVTKYSPENEGTTLSVFNPIKNNDDTVIDNTCLVNQDMVIQAYVQKELTPVKGARVKISLETIDYDNISPYGFGIKVNGAVTDTAVTDDDGIAEFTVSYNGSIDSTYDDLRDCPYISFDVSSTVDNVPNDENITVKFASVLRNGIYVDNNDVINERSEVTGEFATTTLPYNHLAVDVDDIVPFSNHAAGDDGIQQSWNTNDYYPVQYVSSQQVPNTVQLSATPYFILPPDRTASEAKFEVTFPDKNVTTGQTDVSVTGPTFTQSYSIYNDGSDETTTTQVINVPAGLQSMSVFFDSISISKYSQLYIDLYESDGAGGIGKHIFGKTYAGTDWYVKTFGKENGVQIENVSDMVNKGILVVSLQSPGQVDVSTTGYVMSRVTGDFNTNAQTSAEMIEVVDSVTWKDVTASARYTNPEPMEYSEVIKYLPEYTSDENNLIINDKTKYKFEYRLPAFASGTENANSITGNALITAIYTAANGTVRQATYAYPAVRKKVLKDGNWVSANTNMLMPKTTAIKAIFLGYDVLDENGDIQQKTGGITQNKGENVVTVKPASTNVSGAIFVEAKIKVNALDKEITAANKLSDYDRSPLKGADGKYPLYSYVQFVARPEAVEGDGEIPVFRAIEDQYIVISGEVRSSGSNEVQTEQPIKFFVGNTQLTASDVGKTIGNNVTVRYMDDKTGSNGRAYLVLSGDDGSYVKNINVKYDGNFNFKAYASEGTKDEIVATKIGNDTKNICHLEWLDLGLAYQDSVVPAPPALGTWIYNFLSGSSEYTDSESVVDKTWKVGFLPVANSPLGTFTYDFAAVWASKRAPFTPPINTFAGITNIGVKYQFDGVNYENCTEDNTDNSAIITSQKTGETNVIGDLDIKAEKFNVTYYDADGVIQNFDTVGVNSYNFNNKSGTSTLDPGGRIEYTMTWQPGEWQTTFVHPYGTRVNVNQATHVYYRLTDKFDNPVPDTNVKVEATFDNTNWTNGTQYTAATKTDAKGLVDITVKAPGTAGTLIFKVTAADVETATDVNIVYATTTEPELMFAAADPVVDSTNAKKIVLTFNNSINTDKLTSQMLEKLIYVNDDTNSKLNLNIASVKINVKTLTIELKDEEFVEGRDYTIGVDMTGKCTIDGIEYVLYDVNGQAMKAGNDTKSFTCSK